MIDPKDPLTIYDELREKTYKRTDKHLTWFVMKAKLNMLNVYNFSEKQLKIICDLIDEVTDKKMQNEYQKLTEQEFLALLHEEMPEGIFNRTILEKFQGEFSEDEYIYVAKKIDGKYSIFFEYNNDGWHIIRELDENSEEFQRIYDKLYEIYEENNLHD